MSANARLDAGPLAAAIMAARTRSPWLGINTAAEATRWASILRRAHSLAVREDRIPALTRSLVASSWGRATGSGVDPDGRAPRILDDSHAKRAFAEHPISPVLPKVERILVEATKSTKGFSALSDADGLLLWVEGSAEGLEAASGAGFVPGHLASETAVGTNAVGTALAVDDPVQIFSAEHFSRRLHGLSCVAAPIRDPDSQRTIGVLDLSAGFSALHPHSLALVTSIAMTIEGHLATEARRLDDRRRAAYVERVSGGEHSALVAESGRVLAASPRGWLGDRIAIGAGALPVLPRGVALEETRIEGAFLVRAGAASEQLGPDRLVLEPTGFGRVRVTIGDWSLDLSRRRSEILMLLALNPQGLSGLELCSKLSGTAPKPVTLRVEMSRLRKLLGPAIATSPYRIAAAVDADRTALAAELQQMATSPPGVTSFVGRPSFDGEQDTERGETRWEASA